MKQIQRILVAALLTTAATAQTAPPQTAPDIVAPETGAPDAVAPLWAKYLAAVNAIAVEQTAALAKARPAYLAALTAAETKALAAGKIEEHRAIVLEKNAVLDPERRLGPPKSGLPKSLYLARSSYTGDTPRFGQKFEAAAHTYLQSLNALQKQPGVAQNKDLMARIGEAKGKVTGIRHKTVGAASDLDPDATYTIEAGKELGVMIGRVTKGQRITLQYVSGKWTGGSNGSPVSPDETGHATLQLAIIGKLDGKFEPISLVPGPTKQRPFSHTFRKDYAEVWLRSNDAFRGDNSGSAIYKASVK